MTFTPTAEQSAIIKFIAENPETNLMVSARAGAAKSSTIEMSVPGISRHLPVCALAFNKKIADALTEKLPSHVACLTLNAAGHRAWAAARNKRLTIDDDKVYKLARAAVPAEEIAKDDGIFTEVMTLVKKAKGAGLVPSGAPMNAESRAIYSDTSDNWRELGFQAGIDVTDLGILYARSVLLKSIGEAFTGVIDFNDQIYMSVLFGGVYPQYHTVIVDESQDLSPLNHRQVQKMAKNRVIAVGDPYQAIYAFRGADARSMDSLEHMMRTVVGKKDFARLTLTKSFRVPHLVAERQLEHVADFGSMDWLPQGRIEEWPGPLTQHSNTPLLWSIADIPQSGFVLCRNNAPLMKLAFAIIKSRRPVKILGRDIGASLANLLDKICGKSGCLIEDAFAKVEDWKAKELTKAGDSESKRDVIFDRVECLHVMLDATEGKTSKDASAFIRDLFSDKRGDNDLTLSSIHRIKGLENSWVMHLDPFRIPSKMAQKAAEHGNPGPLEQEYNLKYVAETRTLDTLVLANLDDCEEIGE